MRNWIFFGALILIHIEVSGQKLHSNYELRSDFSGHHQLQLNADSSFYFQATGHLSGSWSIGSWKVEKNNLTLIPTPVYDTLTRFHQSDTLVLSHDLSAERVYRWEPILVGEKQSSSSEPVKLFISRASLFYTDFNGKRIRKKRWKKGLGGKSKFRFDKTRQP